jgi:hypothetical protein
LSAAIPPFIIRHFLFDIRYFFLALIYAWFVPARTGLDIHESYGMTESASMVTYNHNHWLGGNAGQSDRGRDSGF